MSRQSISPQPTELDKQFSLLEQLQDLAFIVDAHFQCLAVSQGCEDFFAVSKSQFKGVQLSEFFGVDCVEQDLQPAIQLSLAGKTAQAQFSYTRIGQGTYHFDCKCSPFIDLSSTEPKTLIVMRDITHLIDAQNQLKREHDLLHTIINAIPDFIFAKSADGIYQLCNKSFEEFLAAPASDIIGRSDFELMSRTSAEYISNKDKEVREALKAHRCDEWVSYKDGRRRLLDMYKLPLANADSKTGVLGIGRNVTFEREAEQNLLLASLVFDATPDPCIILSSEGEIISSNEAAQTQFPKLVKPSNPLQLSELIYSPETNKIDLEKTTAANGSWCGEVCSHDHRVFFATLNAVKCESLQNSKFVLIIRDEQTQHTMANNLLIKAYQDALTDLPNRRLFYSRLESAISRAERQLGHLAVLYIDLNNFKPINDQFGHARGDMVLREVAKRLQNCFHSTDTVARLGGDEFVALIDIDNSP